MKDGIQNGTQNVTGGDELFGIPERGVSLAAVIAAASAACRIGYFLLLTGLDEAWGSRKYQQEAGTPRGHYFKTLRMNGMKDGIQNSTQGMQLVFERTAQMLLSRPGSQMGAPSVLVIAIEPCFFSFCFTYLDEVGKDIIFSTGKKK